MANKPKSIIGIDLGHSVFKLAEYNHTKKRVGWVTKKLVESSVWQDETLIAGNLKEILDNPDLHINKKSTGLVLAVYGSQAAFREVQIPAGEKNLLDAVSFFAALTVTSPRLITRMPPSVKYPCLRDTSSLLPCTCKYALSVSMPS